MERLCWNKGFEDLRGMNSLLHGAQENRMENRNNPGKRLLDKDLIRKINAIVGPENVLSSREDLICYGYDATNLEVLPGLVVFPKSVKEISEILILANKNKFPVVPRGMGTGFSGGSFARSRRGCSGDDPVESDSRDRYGKPDRHGGAGSHHRGLPEGG